MIIIFIIINKVNVIYFEQVKENKKEISILWRH